MGRDRWMVILKIEKLSRQYRKIVTVFFLSVNSSQVYHTGSSTWKGHVLMFTNYFERIHS